jgi:uncharacterized protein (TIGR02118 family)
MQKHAGVTRRAGMAFGLAAGSIAFATTARAEIGKGAMKITLLYGAPKDPGAFESYYLQQHMPKIYAVKGVARIEIGKGLPGPDGKPPAYYRIFECWFDNADTMKEVTSRPEWAAIVADVPNYATGGATVLISMVE